MRLLLTNDDGINAPGLKALMRAFHPGHQLTVIAPEVEQSAVGHAITLSQPIQVHRLNDSDGIVVFAVRGTPADCVKLAYWELMAQARPELIVSGINRGANVGLNLLYSGTVSAATEAAGLGLSGLAVSLDTFDLEADYTPAARLTGLLIDRLAGFGLSPGQALNVNIPFRPDLSLDLCRLTKQGLVRPQEEFIARRDPRDNLYYWQAEEKIEAALDPASDQAVLAQGFVSITPIHFDLTDHQTLNRLAGSLGQDGRWGANSLEKAPQINPSFPRPTHHLE